MSEQLTAVWNGYQVTADNAERSVDKLAAIAASTASNLEELSTGMSKVASAANTMGVSEDQLASMLSTVISVTRGAPESIGVAFKTIFARVSDIEQGLSDEFASLGNYSGKMAQFGVEILDANGKMRNMGDIIEDIGEKWETLTKEQQLNLAQTMAGQRQYSNLIALFDNWDKYTKSMDTAANSAGTLQKQQDIYMESTAAHLAQMSAALENVYDSFLDTDTINNFADAISNVANLLAGFLDSIGGGESLLLHLGSVAMSVFNDQIGTSITNIINKIQSSKNNSSDGLDLFKLNIESSDVDEVTKGLVNLNTEIQKNKDLFSEQERSSYKEQIDEITELTNKTELYQEQFETMKKILKDDKISFKDMYAEDIEDKINDINEAIEANKTVIDQSVGSILDYADSLSTIKDGEVEKELDGITEEIDKLTKMLVKSNNEIGNEGLAASIQADVNKFKEELQELTPNSVEYQNKVVEFSRKMVESGRISSQAAQQFIETNNEISRNSAEAADIIANGTNRTKESIDRLRQEVERPIAMKNLISSSTQILGSLSQIGASISTVTNLFKIWGDESLSVTEKLGQTFSNLSVVVLQGVTGVLSLANGLSNLTKNQILLNIAQSAGMVIQGGQLTLTQALKAGYLGLAGAASTAATAIGKATGAMISFLLTNPVGWAILAAGAIIGVGAALIAFSSKAETAEEKIKRLEDQANKSSQAVNKLQESFDKFKDINKSYDDALEGLEKLTKGTIQYNEQVEKANELARQLLEANEGLSAYAKFDPETGLITIDKDAREQIKNEQYQQVQDQRVVAAQDKNELLQAKRENLQLTNFSNSDTQKLIEAIKDNGGRTDKEGLKEAINAAGLPSALKTVFDPIAGKYVNVEETVDDILQKIDTAELDQILAEVKNIENQIDFNNKDLAYGLMSSDEDIKNMSAFDKAAIAGALSNRLDSSEVAEKIANRAGEIFDEGRVREKYAEKIGGSINDEGELLDALGNKLELTDKQISEKLALLETTNELLSEIKSEIPKDSEAFQGDINNLEKSTGVSGLSGQMMDFASSGGKSGFNIALSNEQKESLKQQLMDALEQGVFEDNEEFFKNLGFENAEQYVNSFIEAIEQSNAKDVLYNQFDQKKAAIQDLRKADDFLDGKKSLSELTADEEKALEVLESKYAGLNEFRQAGIEAYQTALRALREAEEEAQKEILKNIEEIERTEFANELDKIEVGVELNEDDLEKLNSELEDFLAADREIVFHITDDIAAEVADIVNEMDKMADGFAKIGEGWRVAANDVRAFAEVFPEIAAQAKVLEDGSFQLSQSMIDNAMNVAGAEIESAKEGMLARIDAERQVLQKKRDAAQAAFEAAQAAADASTGSEQEAADAQAAAVEALKNFKDVVGEENIKNAESVSKAEQQGAIDAETTIAAVSQNNAANALGAAKSMTASYQAWANATIQNANAVGRAIAAAKEGGTSSESTTGFSGGESFLAKSGTSIANSLAATINKATSGAYQGANAAAQNGWQQTANALQQQVTAYDKALANLNVSESELKGSWTNLKDKYTNASSGVGNGSGSSGKKPSSGSGKKPSSSSGSEKEPDTLDYIEEEADRYHDIDIELQNIDRDLSRIEKQQKKLTGKDLIDSLNKQLEILNKQVDAYERKKNIALGELKENKAALQQMGVTFDENGQISNYLEAYKAALKKYNDAISAYNSMSAEQQEKVGKAAVEVAKQEYEKFKEILDRYDELINDVIPDLEDNIQDAIDKQIEINIEKFKMEVEVRLEMASAERKWNEFKRKVIDGIKDDDYLGIIKSQYADLLTYFNTADTGKGPIQTLTEQLNGTLDQLKAMDGTLGDWASAYGDNKAQALEDLQKYLDELMDQMMDVEDLIKDIEKTYLDMIKAIKDAFDEQLNNYKLIDDIIEHNKNVIGLLYGDKAYEQMAHYYDKQEQNNLQQLDFLRQEAAFWKEKMDAEEQGSEAWKQYKKNWEDALGNLNSKVEDSIKTLIDKYANLVDDIFDKLNNKVTNGLGLNYVKDEWDLINKNADEYLDTINRAFETQKLQNKFNEALANTSGLKAQQQIKDLMDQQLGDLEQREKLTQYDVERAEKLLDIELKKIALQDAQQNKSKMRLRRDAQGNYSYQFVSDEQKIADAQKELAAAQNELYNFDKDRYQNNLNKIYETYSEFQEKLKELYANTALSDEERERQKTLLIQQYGELINGLTEQNTQIRLNLEKSAFAELAKMYNTNLDEFMSMTEEQRTALMEGLIPYWNSGIQDMVNTFVGAGGFIPTCTESFESLDQATQDYVNSLTEIEAAAGISFDAIAQGYDKNIELAQELIVKNEELIDQYDRELQAVQEVLAAVRDLAAAYASVKQNAIEASEAAMKYQQEEAKRKAEAAEAERKKQEEANKQQAASSTTTSKPSSGTAQTTTGNTSKVVSMSDVKIGAKFRYTGGIYYYSSTGATPVGSRGPGGIVEVENIAPDAKYKVAVKSTNSAYGWLNVDQLEKLKSGGYTGDWGESGKLAILHQKELVLNADDTQNILSAVAVLRGLSDVLGAKTLANLSNALDKIRVTPVPKDNNKEEEILEQQVTITATFPNVKNSNEVEDAINNLINTAAQRRNRRGR